MPGIKVIDVINLGQIICSNNSLNIQAPPLKSTSDPGYSSKIKVHYIQFIGIIHGLAINFNGDTQHRLSEKMSVLDSYTSSVLASID